MNNLIIENAKIMFKNFSGKPSQFNKEGSRNFCVVIPDIDLDRVRAEGWNVRTLGPKGDDESGVNYIQVAVAFNNYPPKAYMVSNHRKTVTLLDESTIGNLDFADIASVDLNIRPYNWSVNGNEGIKAYLHTGYFVLDEDVFADKYRTEEEEEEEEDDYLPYN